MTTLKRMQPGAPPEADEGVLSTLNTDGSRRWIDPRLSRGRFLTRRRAIAAALIVLFTGLPFVRIGGKPALLFDLPNREFTFFGVTFLPTDTVLLALLILSIFVTIFLLTALFGRVWCGYACPQTVYMEFVFRPIERLMRGPQAWKKPVKLLLYLLVSFYLANTFLAYFVGTDQLVEWMTGPPGEHLGAFAVMAVITALMMIDFTYAREQVCTLMCPYGRFQSVLLDRHSLIIGYDVARGEPRGKLRRDAASDAPRRGDCVACNLCVTTCPTGIDIRNGLQMECIGCAQCIDACDAVMDKIGKPRGLIRYSSRHAIETGQRRLLRPRVVIYPLVLAVVLTGFGFALQRRDHVDLTFLRVRTTPYVVSPDGTVLNRVAIKITNKTDAARAYDLSLVGGGPDSAEHAAIALGPGETWNGEVTVRLPGDRFTGGRAEIELLVVDDRGEEARFPHQVLGPLFATGGSAAKPDATTGDDETDETDETDEDGER